MDKVIEMIETSPTEELAKDTLETMKIFINSDEYREAKELIKKEFND